MNSSAVSGHRFQALREKAEHRLRKENNRSPDAGDEDISRLIHELEVHQVELEMQNQELRQAKTDLQASRDDFADLYESAPVAYITLSPKGLIERANRAAHELLHHEKALPGRPFSGFVHRDDWPVYYAYMNQCALYRKTPEPVEIRLSGRREASPFFVQLAVSRQYNSFKSSPRLRLTLLDISRQKRTEQALETMAASLEAEASQREAELKERKKLAGRLVELLEKDRREMAMMLHDEVGQILTSIKMDMEDIESRMAAGPLLQKLQQARGKTGRTMTAIKNAASELRPTLLENLGLIPAVRALVDNIREYADFDIHLHAPAFSERLEPEKELAVYRIVQEALNNAVKYSEADAVFVSLARRDETVALTVEDNGRGFDDNRFGIAHSPGEHCLGISIMRERATLCGGNLSVESRSGNGVRLMVTIPASPPGAKTL
ncbi:MAG: PAS domain-containing sensor histidine kinase [Thermodesulfobacteriota bacterium]|nr:PAS domain-containing sensor histidine kinase [Thermodesulfobacteriota bacterium]